MVKHVAERMILVDARRIERKPQPWAHEKNLRDHGNAAVAGAFNCYGHLKRGGYGGTVTILCRDDEDKWTSARTFAASSR